MEQDSGYLSLLFGAAIITHFAYRRFHEANLDTQVELGRLHELLSVDAMRTQSVVRLSLICYTMGLLTIYVLLTAYVLLVPSGIAELTASTQGVVGGQIPHLPELGRGLGAVPLGVALVIVGLGTSFPYVRKVEEWLRGACHRLAGIPTKVLDHARALHRMDRIGEDGVPLPLLSHDDQKVLQQVRARLSGDSDECGRDLALIAAVSEWVLRRRVIHADPPARRQFLKLETQLLDRKIALFRRLRAMLTAAAGQPGPALQHGAGEDSRADPPDSSTPAVDWGGIRGDAELLADDMCMLLALYREHQIILPASVVPAAGSGDARGRNKSPGDHARAILVDFVSHGDSDMDKGAVAARMAILAVAWSFGVIVIICVLWAALPGTHEARIAFPGNPARGNLGVPERLLTYLSNGIFAYFIPVVIGVAIWQGATAAGSWNDGLRGHWTSSQPRALMLILSGWLVATLLLSGVHIWWSASRAGWAVSERDSLNTLIRVSGAVAPTALRGAFLAALVVECLDRYWQKGAAAPDRHARSITAALRAALILGVAGVLTRWLVIEINIGAAVTTAIRRQVDEYDRGLMAYAGALSALIAFVLIYGLSEALRTSRILVPGQQATLPAPPTPKPGTVTRLPVVLAVLSALLVSAGAASAERLTIGVRTDARPYIWKDGQSGAHRGYLFDVCTSMAQRAGYDFDIVEVDATVREAFLTRGEGPIDLLCDPTTITLGRVQGFLKPPISGRLTFLPIFHIASSSYLEMMPADDRAKAAAKAAICGDGSAAFTDTAPSEVPDDRPKAPWIRLWLPELKAVSTPAPTPQRSLWGAVRGTTSADRLEAAYQTLGPAEGARVCLDMAASHHEAAGRLCAGQWQRYYGDEELIAAAVAALPQPCNPRRAEAAERHYEPYALVVSNARHCGLDQILAAQIYAMGAERSLEGKLKQHFKEASISPSLQALLATLALPSGRAVEGEPVSPPVGPCGPLRGFGSSTTRPAAQPGG